MEQLQLTGLLKRPMWVSMNFQAGLCWFELVSNVGITKEVLPVTLVEWGHQHPLLETSAQDITFAADDPYWSF